MLSNKITILTLANLLFALNLFAQSQLKDSVDKKMDYRFSIGTTVGGSSPMGVPAEIRKILKYNPAVPFFAKAQAIYHIDPKWAVGTGLSYVGNGMSTKARVKAYKTTFNESSDPSQKISGYFYGDISTNVKNTYLQIPVTAFYQISDKWEVNAGPYFGFALSRKFDGTAYDGYMRDETPVGTSCDY